MTSNSRARSGVSKKLVQLYGLVTSLCGVPQSRRKVFGPSMERVVRKPLYWFSHHVWRAQGVCIAVTPPTSIPASHLATCGGTPRLVESSSMA